MMKSFVLFLLCPMMLISCGNKLAQGILPPAAMKMIMWDMMVAEQVRKSDTSQNVRLHLKDSTTASYTEILGIYNVSFKKYQKSIRYYESRPDLLKDLFDSVGAYGKRLTDSLKPKEKKIVKKPALSSDSLRVKSPDSNKLKIKLPEKYFGAYRNDSLNKKLKSL